MMTTKPTFQRMTAADTRAMCWLLQQPQAARRARMARLVSRLGDGPFYVALTHSTVDWSLSDGIAEIPIEERVGEELLHLAGQRTAAIGIEALNPVFDVTPAALIAAIVCEKGVIRPVSRSSVERVLGLS